MSAVAGPVSFALGIYWYILVARLIFEWIPAFSPSWRPRGPLLVLATAVYSLTDPPVRLVRKIVPTVRIGSVSLDITFIILLLGINFLQWILGSR
ncbi:MAG: YggT family protein [Actinobacteria bacterium]|nr:YggT family protein [Actinomycetota bacterium]NBY15611.1 YggT family protein [Actinomycetota bacterium]